MFPAPPVWVERPEKSELREGEAGYLHCHAKANPDPEVAWFRNNAPIEAEVPYRRPAASAAWELNWRSPL